MSKPVIVVRTETLDRPAPSEEQLDLAIRNAARNFDKALEERRKRKDAGIDVEEFTEWK